MDSLFFIGDKRSEYEPTGNELDKPPPPSITSKKAPHHRHHHGRHRKQAYTVKAWSEPPSYNNGIEHGYGWANKGYFEDDADKENIEVSDPSGGMGMVSNQVANGDIYSHGVGRVSFSGGCR